MTKGIETNTIAERTLWKSWKRAAERHNSYDVRNKYHRDGSMDMWWEKKKGIDKLYRMILISHNKKPIVSVMEKKNGRTYIPLSQTLIEWILLIAIIYFIYYAVPYHNNLVVEDGFDNDLRISA